jgi:hypothetical protein
MEKHSGKMQTLLHLVFKDELTAAAAPLNPVNAAKF